MPLPADRDRASHRRGAGAVVLRTLAVLLAAAAAALGAVCGSTAPAFAQDDGAAILAAQVTEEPGVGTRIILDLTRPRGFRLAASAERPRMTLDFLDTIWAAAPATPTGVVEAVSSRSLSTGGVRVGVDLSEPAGVADIFYLPATAGGAFRLVLDLSPGDAQAYARLLGQPILGELGGSGEAPAGPPAPPAPDPVLADGAAATAAAPGSGISVPLPPRRPSPRRPLVAIDAGHGGRDPGAVGIHGELEKDITLAVALDLADALSGTGRYDVVLTRDDDRFLALRERVRIARAAGADLFLSLHADSVENNESIRGASIYTLSARASDRQAERLAQRENRADALGGVAIDPEDGVMVSILIDLAQRLTRNESFTAAELLVDTLGAAVPLLPTRPHRQAGFVVLTAPDMPSVLIEMGYLSNAEEEALLVEESYRAALTAAIVEGVDRYFAWEEEQRRS